MDSHTCNYTSYTDTHTYSLLGIYIIVYIDTHTLLRFFLLLAALETYFIVGGECFAPQQELHGFISCRFKSKEFDVTFVENVSFCSSPFEKIVFDRCRYQFSLF